jgi:hypothetical protein
MNGLKNEITYKDGKWHLNGVPYSAELPGLPVRNADTVVFDFIIKPGEMLKFSNGSCLVDQDEVLIHNILRGYVYTVSGTAGQNYHFKVESTSGEMGDMAGSLNVNNGGGP